MSTITDIAKETLRIEAAAIGAQVDLVGEAFEAAVSLIAASDGKLVVTGMGKSGIIGRKISATLASTGTPSFYLHPGEAYHGDLGMLNANDIVLALSFSGETDEILKIIPFFRDNGNPVIAITGNPDSTLARNADIHLAIRIEKEACSLTLAPTSSTTVTLALGDALAMALMNVKNFSQESFARFHPGGSLGRRLLARVSTIMRTGDLPVISSGSRLTEIITVMSHGKAGLAMINEGNITTGIITDGDLRRLLEARGKEAFDLTAGEIMTGHPKTIRPEASLSEAEEMFIKYKINSLIVVNDRQESIGLVQIYNL